MEKSLPAACDRDASLAAIADNLRHSARRLAQMDPGMTLSTRVVGALGALEWAALMVEDEAQGKPRPATWAADPFE